MKRISNSISSFGVLRAIGLRLIQIPVGTGALLEPCVVRSAAACTAPLSSGTLTGQVGAPGAMPRSLTTRLGPVGGGYSYVPRLPFQTAVSSPRPSGTELVIKTLITNHVLTYHL